MVLFAQLEPCHITTLAHSRECASKKLLKITDLMNGHDTEDIQEGLEVESIQKQNQGIYEKTFYCELAELLNRNMHLRLF